MRGEPLQRQALRVGDRALEEFTLASSLANIDVVGVHKHIGSQLTEVTPFVEAVKKVVKLVGALKEQGIDIRYVNIGGGLGITYSDETPPLPQDLVKVRCIIWRICRKLGVAMVIGTTGFNTQRKVRWVRPRKMSVSCSRRI